MERTKSRDFKFIQKGWGISTFFLITVFAGVILLVGGSPFSVSAKTPPQAPGVTTPPSQTQTQGGGGNVVEIPNPISAGDFPTLVNQIADWLLSIGLIISTGVVIWSAYLFLFAGGNKDRVTQARNTLWYAIIGIVILLLAKGVASIIASFFSP